jgi:hypothetical protein
MTARQARTHQRRVSTQRGSIAGIAGIAGQTNGQIASPGEVRGTLGPITGIRTGPVTWSLSLYLFFFFRYRSFFDLQVQRLAP